ncbi:uncharacterized protein FTOL_00255 [Fusarium torulosum]|uniref:CCHC-type domain-containing protein n=1 Tax=Fusarium torulosum TaxID=33205 RepID=A0AAE8LXS5_9HYPO|nr:uncharacterized protein FTOL_00255 [Fusarium torulosum]
MSFNSEEFGKAFGSAWKNAHNGGTIGASDSGGRRGGRGGGRGGGHGDRGGIRKNTVSRCYRCGSFGHLLRDCPNTECSPEQQPQQPAVFQPSFTFAAPPPSSSGFTFAGPVFDDDMERVVDQCKNRG